MIVRDIDVLQELTRVAGCTVQLSVPRSRGGVARAGAGDRASASAAARRAHAARRGNQRRRPHGPVVPGFTTQTSKLEATIQACAEHGAAFMGANLLYLKGGTKDHFMGFLRHSFPDMVESYTRLYPGAYAAPEYVGTVRALIEMLQERHQVNTRARRTKRTAGDADATSSAEPEQTAFGFQ